MDRTEAEAIRARIAEHEEVLYGTKRVTREEWRAIAAEYDDLWVALKAGGWADGHAGLIRAADVKTTHVGRIVLRNL